MAFGGTRYRIKYTLPSRVSRSVLSLYDQLLENMHYERAAEIRDKVTSISVLKCPSGEIGRRTGLKILG